MLSLLLFVLFYVSIANSDIIEDFGVSKCLTKILEEDFLPRSVFLTFFFQANATNSFFIVQQNVIAHVNKIPKIIVDVINNNGGVVEFSKNNQHKNGHLLIMVENLQAFLVTIQTYFELSFFNSRAVCFVFVKNEKEVDAIFEVLWKYKMYKITIVAPNESFLNLKVYVWNIRSQSGKCLERPTKLLMGVYKTSDCDKTKVVESIPTKFNCTLDVFALKFIPFVIDKSEGLEVDLIKEMGVNFGINFNIEMVPFVDYWNQKNLEYVQQKNIMAVGHMLVAVEMRESFDYTVECYWDKIVWVVPKAALMPKWKNIIGIFSKHIWWAILMVFITSLVVTYFLTKLHVGNNTNTFDTLDLVRVFLGNPLKKQIKLWKTKIIFAALLLYQLMICAAYQCFLINYLTHPLREYQISTYEEMRTYGLQIGGIDNEELLNVLKISDENIEKVYKSSPEKNKIGVWLRDAANGTIGTATSELYVRYMLSQKDLNVCASNGDPKVHVLEKAIITARTHILMPKGFPLVEPFDGFITRMSTSGLLWKLVDKYNHRAERDFNDYSRVSLSLDHLQGAFLVLLMNNLFGIVVLIVENVVFRLKN